MPWDRTRRRHHEAFTRRGRIAAWLDGVTRPHEHDHERTGYHPEPDPDLRGRLTRRGLIGGATGGLLVAASQGHSLPSARASPATPAAGAARTSRITRGTTLVHADMHNHTLMSDGDGDPADAFASMRDAGLDVAALTDHSTASDTLLGDALDGLVPPGYTQFSGLSRRDWARTGRLADAADDPGSFTAIRGFEWSDPLLGHMNVWFSAEYTDILEATSMRTFYSWLRRDPDGWIGLFDGGADGIAGFNHPGREVLRFADFAYDRRLRDRMVSMEIFNRRDDYLFEGWDSGMSSPLVACLAKGWRTGLTGVTDEHGTEWGRPEGKGRTGMWVTEHSRRGVRAAMEARRFFATRSSGVRLDATMTIGGREYRMGGVAPTSGGTATFAVDFAGGGGWTGRRLDVQVLRPGDRAPEVVEVRGFTVGGVVRFDVPLHRDEGSWVVLRISDPAEANATPGPDGHACNDLGVAYTSPWWLDPA